MTKFHTAKHNYADDEVKSALQKEIRRGYEDSAMYWALELANEYVHHKSKGKATWKWLVRRLRIICYEDIGVADSPVINSVLQSLEVMDDAMDRYIYDLNTYEKQIKNLKEKLEKYKQGLIKTKPKKPTKPSDEHWLMPLSYILFLMCNAKKNRIIDHYKLGSKTLWNNKTLDIPDYAIDCHTTKGNKKGLKKHTKKGKIHFEKVSAKLENKVEVKDEEFWYLGYLKNRGLTEEDLK